MQAMNNRKDLQDGVQISSMEDFEYRNDSHCSDPQESHCSDPNESLIIYCRSDCSDPKESHCPDGKECVSVCEVCFVVLHHDCTSISFQFVVCCVW